MTTKWKPSGNKVLVLMDKAETTTKSGIIIAAPGTLEGRAEMQQMEGVIVDMGPTAYHDQKTPWAQVGDRVRIAKFAGWLFEDGDVKYRVLHDLDIMMVLGE
jgi:co-chaperonin GroES (HSP10)